MIAGVGFPLLDTPSSLLASPMRCDTSYMYTLWKEGRKYAGLHSKLPHQGESLGWLNYRIGR